MEELKEESPEEAQAQDNMFEEQDHIMLMIGNASYHYFDMEDEKNGEVEA